LLETIVIESDETETKRSPVSCYLVKVEKCLHFISRKFYLMIWWVLGRDHGLFSYTKTCVCSSSSSSGIL